MNTIDDLTRSLERHTSLAPDSIGMIEQAKLGAGRIRLRRRIVGTMAASVAILSVAAGMPLLAQRDTLPGSSRPPRSAAEMTIGLAGDGGFTVQQRAATGARQLLVARTPGAESFQASGEVSAYDPGAFDPDTLPPGEAVRVGGHDALLVPTLSKDRLEFLKSIGGFPSTRPSVTPSGAVTVNTGVESAVVWEDPSGIWVTVTNAQTRDVLLRLAAAVRVGEPSPPLGPIGLTRLPNSLAVTHAETMEEFPGMYAKITLTVPEPGTNAVPAASAVSVGPGRTRVEILVEPRTNKQWNDGLELPESTFKIAGHPAWYSEGEVAGYTFTPTEGRLMIETDTCGIRVQTDDFTKVTGAELKQMMNLATYGSCTNMADWTPVVP